MIVLPAPSFAVEIAQDAALMQVGPNPSPGQASPLPIPRRRRGEAAASPPPELVRPDLPAQDRLASCIAKAARDPHAAVIDARLWVAEGADAAQRVRANHCLGLILANAGDFNGALAAFADAVAGIPAEQAVAAVPLMGMAGNAALAGDRAQDALGWFDRALAVQGYADNAVLGTMQADRARALVALGRDGDAAAALDEAHRLAPEDADGWLLSATLARRQGDLVRAQRDIEVAARYAPRDPQVGLEAGVIAVLGGHDDAARKSWQSVLATDPDSPSGAIARGYLEQLGSLSLSATTAPDVTGPVSSSPAEKPAP